MDENLEEILMVIEDPLPLDYVPIEEMIESPKHD